MTRGALLALPLLLLLPLLAAPARAATETRVDLVATEVNGVPTFVDAAGNPDPTLHALPGSRVTIHLANHGALKHNLVLGAPVNQSMPCCLAPGAEADLTVDLPAGFAGSVAYQCALHGGNGMRGTLLVGAPPPSVWFVSPTNGTTVHGPATARVQVGNVTLGEGYALRWLVDGKALPNATGAEAPLGELAQGDHLAQVEIVNATGASLSPPAKAEVVFFEDPTPLATPPTAAEPAPVSSSTPPAKTPLPAALVAIGAAAAATILRRSR